MEPGFLCHTSMKKGGRELSHDFHTLNTTVTKKADSCPLTTDFTAHGVRGVTCSASTQSYKMPFWAAEGNTNSAIERTTCATKGGAAGDYSAL